VEQANTALRKWKPVDPAAIGECWNAGHPLTDLSVGVARHLAGLAKNYTAHIAFMICLAASLFCKMHRSAKNINRSDHDRIRTRVTTGEPRRA
jgi:hypothetical protein